MRIRCKCFLWTAACLAAPAIATAQADSAVEEDPSFSHADEKTQEELAEETEKVAWSASAQGGLILTTGNSRATTVSGAAKASRRANRNRFELEAGGAFSRSSVFVALDDDDSGTLEADEIDRQSTTTTRAWNLEGRYDRFLTDHNSLYGLATIGGDQPAGKNLYGGGQLGYSRLAYKSERHSLVAEAGYDFTYEDPVVGDSLSIHSLRAYVAYTGKLSEDTGVEASVEGLYNLNGLDYPYGAVGSFRDRRHTGRVAISTEVYDDISLRFGFEARHDSAPSVRPPLAVPYAPGFFPRAEKLDTKTEASLIVSFL